MNSFLSDIIDCVALPSTSDTPVRMLRKCNSCNESPSIEEEVDEPSTNIDTSCHSSVSSVIPNAIEPIKSILTADGIIDGEGDAYDNVAVLTDDADEEEDVLGYSIGSSRSHRSIDDSTARIFEEAFAEFLWSNPAFSSMSCTTLIRLRERLRWQSAKNAKVEAELRMQLDQLKEENRTTELMLQKELLHASKVKLLREAELQNYQESRDDRAVISRSSMLTSPSSSRVSASYAGCSGNACQDGVRRSKLEQAHMIAEVQKMKRENMKKLMPHVMH